MSDFALTHSRSGSTIVIDTDDLEPGELQALKALGEQPSFQLRRIGEGQRIPPMDHDALDDIALEVVGKTKGFFGHDHLLKQAHDRIKQRGLQR